MQNTGDRSGAWIDMARTILRFALFFLFGSLLWYPVFFLIENAVYPTMCAWFPSLFRTYHFMTEKAAYEALLAKQRLVATIIAALLTVLIAVRTDNRRYENIIAETDGFYRLREGLRAYLKQNLITDILSAWITPIPVFALYLLIPVLVDLPIESSGAKQLADLFSVFTNGAADLSARFGAAVGYLFAVLLILACHLPATICALRWYRAAWLSAFAE